MIHYKNYVKPKDLEEAYKLNEKRSSVIAGGFCFLRLQNRTVGTLLDLKELLSGEIEETEEEFRIGAMTPLRTLELHKELNVYTDGAAADCVRHIVGTQFRNCATIGGSLFGRFGFSDLLTCFLVMDSYAELYKRGRMPLAAFAKEKPDEDILTALIVKKTPLHVAYERMQNEAVDFPVLSVAAAEWGDQKTRLAIGARPARAELAVWDGYLSELEPRMRRKVSDSLAVHFTYGSNMRASAEYRQYLAGVLADRAAGRIAECRKRQEDETER